MYPNVSKCNANRCVCCTHLCTKSNITSSVNGRQFSIINNNDVDWTSSDLIYVITCILGQVWYLIVSIPDLCTLTISIPEFNIYGAWLFFSSMWTQNVLFRITHQSTHNLHLTIIFLKMDDLVSHLFTGGWLDTILSQRDGGLSCGRRAVWRWAHRRWLVL